MAQKSLTKTILITGASKGIGRQTALLFAHDHNNIIITYNTDEQGAIQTADECHNQGAKEVLVQPLNICNEQSILQLLHNVRKKFGEIDILINNAGVIVWKPFEEQTEEEIKLQLDTNLYGVIRLTHNLLPYVNEAIIMIGSGAGKKGYADLVPYCATKFGVRGFTQSLAQAYPEKRIFCVNPGLTATQMTNFQGKDPRQIAHIIHQTALGKYDKPNGSDIDVSELL